MPRDDLVSPVLEYPAERANEKETGATASDMMPSLSWSKVSFINEVNAWKNGHALNSPMNDDGTRGLTWRHRVSTDVFERASVDAAQALKNWTESKRGVCQGKVYRISQIQGQASHYTEFSAA